MTETNCLINISSNDVDKSAVGRLTISEKLNLTNKGRKGAFSSVVIHGVTQNKNSGKMYIKTNHSRMATNYIIVTENRNICADFEDIRSKFATPRTYISSLFSGDQNRYKRNNLLVSA